MTSYLDTTWCTSLGQTIPDQDEAIVYVSNLINDLISISKESSESTLVVIGKYFIGKERLLMSIARNTGNPILKRFLYWFDSTSPFHVKRLCGTGRGRKLRHLQYVSIASYTNSMLY